MKFTLSVSGEGAKVHLLCFRKVLHRNRVKEKDCPKNEYLAIFYDVLSLCLLLSGPNTLLISVNAGVDYCAPYPVFEFNPTLTTSCCTAIMCAHLQK